MQQKLDEEQRRKTTQILESREERNRDERDQQLISRKRKERWATIIKSGHKSDATR